MLAIEGVYTDNVYMLIPENHYHDFMQVLKLIYKAMKT